MATIVSFHAHPDDETIPTGGTLAKAAAEGHRVVIVIATRGEHGEVEEGFLDPGEELWTRRVKEAEAAAAILGAHRLEFLGYVDSGMMGTAENDAPTSFWRADVEEAAGRLAAILRQEDADVLTVYDDHGTYGHPDHIQVHRVGVRAGEMAGTPRVFEATSNREEIARQMSRAVLEGVEMPGDLDEEQLRDFGSPEADITTRIDVRDFLRQKRSAMAAHASQISETSFFLAMPDEMFGEAFGTEWYIHRGVAPGTRERDLFEGLGVSPAEQ
jgi:LmbE family N-acetylglucosaminyl deacetylase